MNDASTAEAHRKPRSVRVRDEAPVSAGLKLRPSYGSPTTGRRRGDAGEVLLNCGSRTTPDVEGVCRLARLYRPVHEVADPVGRSPWLPGAQVKEPARSLVAASSRRLWRGSGDRTQSRPIAGVGVRRTERSSGHRGAHARRTSQGSTGEGGTKVAGQERTAIEGSSGKCAATSTPMFCASRSSCSCGELMESGGIRAGGRRARRARSR